MKKLLSLAAVAVCFISSVRAATLDLSTVSADTTVANGTILTGTLGGTARSPSPTARRCGSTT